MSEWQDITDYLYEQLKKHSWNRINIPNFNLEKLVFKHSSTISPNKKPKNTKRGLYKAKHKTYKYKDFCKVNILHNNYFENLVKTNGILLNQVVAKMELTGAKMECSNFNGEFIVCEERKNVIYGILPDDSIKLFPKANRVFKFSVEGKCIYLFGEDLKLKRCYKK